MNKLLLTLFFYLPLMTNPQEISFNLDNSSIKVLILEVESQTDFKFSYGDEVDITTKLNGSFKFDGEELNEVINELSERTAYTLSIVGNNITITIDLPKKKPKIRPNVQFKVEGTVTDPNGMPIPGVNVIEKGTSNGVVTNFEGEYNIDVPPQAVLVFSYLGYATTEIAVDGQAQLDITMESETSALEEVVVMGYGTQSRRNVTGSVSSIKTAEIKSLPKSNVVEMLDGRLPGVQIMSDNSPGGGASIRVRGFSTINNNDPLVIIDGVPASDGLNSINPLDIETMQVLKDAASTAIYGSRAANGVVVITTGGGGRNDFFEIQVDAYAGMQSAFNLPKMLSAQGYGDMLWQAFINDGKTPSSDIYGDNPNNPVVPEWLDDAQTVPSANVNWIEEIMEPAPIYLFNFSMAKGEERGNHYFSVGYFNQDGIIRYTGFDRYSARFNSTYDVTDFITVGENFTASYTERVSSPTNSALGSIVFDAFQFPSIVPVHDINGGFGGNPINDIQNPLGNLYRSKDNKRKSVNALGNIFASFKISDFKFRTSFGINYENNNYRGFSPVFDEIIPQSNINSLVTSNSYNYQMIFSNTLNYTKEFGNHNIDILLGQEAIEYYSEGFDASRDNFLYEDLSFRYLSFGAENQLNSGNAYSWSLLSYFGRLKYNFDQRYLISATLRRDGTSRLANNNWGIFPAVSAGWRIDREDFFDLGESFTSFLLRASWGQTGNQQIPSYSTVNSYSNNSAYSDYAIGGWQNAVSNGLTQTRVANPNLEWETTTQTTIAIDLGFLNDRLDVTAEYYNKTTDDILVYSPVPLTYGGTNAGQWINGGQMKNHGYELAIGYSSEELNDFRYDLSLNVSSYKNELTELTGIEYLGIPSSTLHSVNFDQEISRSAVGEPIGSFFGFVADGLFQNQEEVEAYGLQENAQPGDIKFRDVNADGTLDSDDRTFIGSPHPNVSLGFNVNLYYKKFDLGMFFNGSFGNDIYNLTKYKTHFFNQAAYNKSTAVLDAWSPDNLDSEIPRLSLDDPNNNIRPSSYYVEDGSYFKLNNLQLGYTFDIQDNEEFEFRIYVQASNVFTITNYKGMTPQIGLQNYTSTNRNLDIGVDRGIYPPSRTFTLGCNLSL